MEIPDTFPESLKYLRQKYQYSQQQLADIAGVSQTSIYQWEKGIRKPKIEQLDKLAYALGVTIVDLDPDMLVYDLLRYEYAKARNNENKYYDERTIKEYEILRKESVLTSHFYKLNSMGQDEAIKRVEELTEIKKYRDPLPDDNI